MKARLLINSALFASFIRYPVCLYSCCVLPYERLLQEQNKMPKGTNLTVASENVPSDVCARQRVRSACALAQSD